jgi:hypothetical protein
MLRNKRQTRSTQTAKHSLLLRRSTTSSDRLARRGSLEGSGATRCDIPLRLLPRRQGYGLANDAEPPNDCRGSHDPADAGVFLSKHNFALITQLEAHSSWPMLVTGAMGTGMGLSRTAGLRASFLAYLFFIARVCPPLLRNGHLSSRIFYKPKGMLWRTFHRLCDRYDHHDAVLNAGLIRAVQRLGRRFGSA